jgi:hypothetical protein
MLAEALRAAPHKSPWAAWLTTEDGTAASETREFLESCFQTVPETKHAGIIKKKITPGDAAQIDATLHELVAYKLLHQLSFEPEYDPGIRGLEKKLTPDIAVQIFGQQFIVDVFVRHTPRRTITRHTWGYSRIDHGDAAKEFGERISEKCRKYEIVGLPLLLVAFLGDFMLKTASVEAALYGASIGDGNLDDQFPQRITALRPPGGVLLPESGTDSPRHPNLSAVVACSWFDTSNRENPGKRLHCLVLHHWHPTVRAHPGAFHPFPELAWRETQSGFWKPYLTAPSNLVARFGVGNRFEFREYKADQSW